MEAGKLTAYNRIYGYKVELLPKQTLSDIESR